MRKLKWGVIGSGGIAFRRTIPEGIIPASNAELVAVCDVNEDLARKSGEKFGVRFYTEEDALINAPDVESVYIATPAYLHFKQAEKVLKAKKHALVEKPITLKVEEGKKIVSLAKRNRVKIGVDFMMRFNTINQKIKEMVLNGELGKIVMARAQLSCWYPPIKGAWRQIPKLGGGGSFIDMGCHCMDLLEFIIGSRIKEIICMGDTLVHKYPVEDTSVALARFQNGAIGIIDSCFSIPDNSSKNILEIYGSKGSVIAMGTIGQSPDGTATAYLETSTKGYDAQQTRQITSTSTKIEVKPYNTYRAQIENFSSSVLEDKDVLNSGEDGVRNQALVIAAYKSIKTKKVEKVLIK
ncbi:MAG TPA: Gfo/Idh/MocA family oxidoreductase [bacterium]|jgi:predicted dehydrogenase|uniref:1,5-anhydro-D-fructose reductase n=1 Tax=candidate division TA06 bacterium ADurb.Bin131 TaxID=1852827 RepID=A0A1V6CAP1_UNCT6|nr:MAG: 1,5-anhydro-D-fructose reductase [candidate division TA06 bacterium ADurb.Bin131]HOC02377.1 Gfo/Idh/MocA family oxidoreductase [bacterium]HRV04099.1 Gfo/Idh/MocA family oxidoreductase [Candidatus Ratteibacteria bacterium]HON06375.1 Gfo/Idh/MocA family oxidoreductase [bacterium]HOQ81565.1 Gfo/Idh/MocA family oxidoreductase [bacterium]